MMTKDQAIEKVVQQNNVVENLLNQAEMVRREADKRCAVLQNEINQLVGRNDAIREIFELTQKELEEAVAADRARAQKTPAEKPVVLPDPPVDKTSTAE
jgi:hypothetical protein